MIIIKNKIKRSELVLKKLGKKIKTKGDLALPAPEKKALQQVANQARGRKGGLLVLFEGEDSAGKSTAAEMLSGELGMELYRIDLSAVISKYIGETEKNLASIFDAASSSNVLLFFDEADALFGKRTEVKDSHDRFANLEVSHLLKHMDGHALPVILSAGSKAKLDPGVSRRIHFRVKFG